jgi:hypothetical protein
MIVIVNLCSIFISSASAIILKIKVALLILVTFLQRDFGSIYN